MAQVVSFELTDVEGRTRRLVQHMPDSATVADMITWAQSQANFVDAASSARLTAAEILIQVDLSGATIKGAPEANSRVATGATLSYKNSADVAYSQYFPAVVDSLMSGGEVSNTGAMNSWISGVLNGGASADPSDQNGLDLVSYTRGREAGRRK